MLAGACASKDFRGAPDFCRGGMWLVAAMHDRAQGFGWMVFFGLLALLLSVALRLWMAD
jgi:hypothetical protein